MLNFVFALILQPELHQTADILVQRGILAQKARFRPVEILAEGDEFYVVRSVNQDRKALRAGDEVVIRGTGLYDGKLLEF